MKDTEPLLESAGETAEYAKQYLKLQIDYLRLESAEKIAKVGSSLFASLAIAALGLIALLMLTLAAGFYLGRLWDSYPLAFLCLAGFYALLAGLVWVFKERWLTNPMLHSIIRSFFK
ncbi:MAG: phage holin family protein [Saprospirales bacterium]|nr:phage holin family protein [Saprospirales bacterium]MBK8923911.1 phage holin family protein [Saprospirales bacterium]